MVDRGDRVVLVAVRDSRRFGLQVLSKSIAAAAGAGSGDLSFPGDRIDSGDHAAPTLKRCHDLTWARARRLLGYEMSPAYAMGCWVAAARVLLATTGLLFAVMGEHRTPVQRRVPPRERQALSESGLDFANFLIREQLHCDLGRLFFFTQWVDPGSGDATRFFLVNVPADLRSAGAVWHAPDRALLLWRDGDLPLDFETFACLRILTDFSSCDSLLSEYQTPETPQTRLDLIVRSDAKARHRDQTRSENSIWPQN